MLRHQTAAGAKALAGLDGKGLTDAAREIAVTAAAGASRNVGNFANPGSYGDGGLSEGEAGNGGDDDGGGSGAPGAGGGVPGGNGVATNGNDGMSVSAPEMVPPENIVPATPGTPMYESPLDDPAVQAVIATLPTLQKDLENLDNDKWMIVYDSIGDADGEAMPNKKLIRINTRLRTNPLRIVRLIAHEVGHVRDGFTVDYSSENACVQSLLLSEGDAILYGIKVERENGLYGPSMNIGLPGTITNHGMYYRIYDNLSAREITRKTARQQIADIYMFREKVGSKTYGQSYRDKCREKITGRKE